MLYLLSYAGPLRQSQNTKANPPQAASEQGLTPLLLAFALPAPAAGAPFPPLTGEFLTGRKAALSNAANGKVTLLALGVSYDSRFAVAAFVKQWRKQCGADPRTSFFEVPMIGGAARMGNWFIGSGMRRGTPVADREHAITVYGCTAEWKRRLGCGSAKSACLVLLDPQGNINWVRRASTATVWTNLQSQAADLLDNTH